MSDYKYMAMSTTFYRNIAGHDISFMVSVDCKGRVSVRPTSVEHIQSLFPEGLVMEFLDDELLIYPYQAPHSL
jgi:hypothetical protein